MDPGKVGQMNKYIKDGNWWLKYLFFTEYMENGDKWYSVRSDDSLVWINSFNFHRKQPNVHHEQTGLGKTRAIDHFRV